MRNWSMVRTGSTSSQKSLFFNMRRVQARLEREAMANGETLDKHQLRQMIATEVGVPLHDVEMMEGPPCGVRLLAQRHAVGRRRGPRVDRHAGG
jgi:RNA polymerase sigma-32 factor